MKTKEIQIHVVKRILAIGSVLALIAQAWLLFTVLTGTLIFLSTKKGKSLLQECHFRVKGT